MKKTNLYFRFLKLKISSKNKCTYALNYGKGEFKTLMCFEVREILDFWDAFDSAIDNDGCFFKKAFRIYKKMDSIFLPNKIIDFMEGEEWREIDKQKKLILIRLRIENKE